MSTLRPKSSLIIHRKKRFSNASATFHPPVPEDTPRVVSTFHPPVPEDAPQVVSTFHPPVPEYVPQDPPVQSSGQQKTPVLSRSDKVLMTIGLFFIYMALLSFIVGGIMYMMKVVNGFSAFGLLAFILFVIGMGCINSTTISKAVDNLAYGPNATTCCTYDPDSASDSSD